MARVTVEDCIEKIPNRFDLVLTAAQRARNIQKGELLTIDRDDDKNPVIALREIADETIDIQQIEDRIVQSMQRLNESEEEVTTSDEAATTAEEDMSNMIGLESMDNLVVSGMQIGTGEELNATGVEDVDTRLLTLTIKQPKLNPDVKTVIHQAIMSAQVKTKTRPQNKATLLNRRSLNFLMCVPLMTAAGLDKLKRAYLFGRSAHDGQSASGEPYFTHPLRVAHLLAEMRLDTDTLVTALLHDTVEDCEVTLKDIATEFGENVAMLVDGVTKLSRLELQSVDTKQAENFRKFVLAVGKDIRVLLVKLADRTHNMQTLKAVSSLEKRRRIATETMEIYALLRNGWGLPVSRQSWKISALKFCSRRCGIRLSAGWNFWRLKPNLWCPKSVLNCNHFLPRRASFAR